MAMGGILSITYTGLIISCESELYRILIKIATVLSSFAVHRYNRHQWDIPSCWVDSHYLRVPTPSLESYKSDGYN